jgi:hypothetical protein
VCTGSKWPLEKQGAIHCAPTKTLARDKKNTVPDGVR